MRQRLIELFQLFFAVRARKRMEDRFINSEQLNSNNV
jgi:hypothetical protein